MHHDRTAARRPQRHHRPRPAAADGQPPRSHHWRHRHRQDCHPADAGRALLQHRRSVLHVRRERRPVRRVTGRRRQRLGGRAGRIAQARKLRLPGLSGHPVVPLRHQRSSGARHRIGHGPAAVGAHAGPQRYAERRTQPGVKVADDNGLLLLDLKDLRAMLAFVGENAKQFTTEYGNVSSASIGAIQRGLLTLESQGGEQIFGEPMLNIADLIQTDRGRGVINILSADKLMQSPKLYATLLLWLLSELFEHLPEAGDLDKPKLVFFFDEAHLLFNDAPEALVEKIEQVVRLIRSKGVGVYFVTQNPADVPDKVLSQLGNRVQHALRAFSPRDQKAVKAAAETMRDNPALDEAAAITELGVGEALVSLLDAKGRPGVVERAFIVPPQGQIGPITDAQRAQLIQSSLVAGVYDKTIDRESASETLKARAEQSAQAAAQAKTAAQPATGGGLGGVLGEILTGNGRRQGAAEALAKSAARAIGSQVGRSLIRGVLGSLFGSKR